MSSSFGTLWRVTTFGESHGGGVGAVIDGCPPRLELDLDAVQAQLDRRRPGQNRLATPRNEPDRVEVLSGLQDGRTLGTPLALLVRNRDQRPGDYDTMRDVPRPSHADYTYERKYGIRAASGGGRSSARETIGRVAAGAVAEQWLAREFGLQLVAWVDAVGTVAAPGMDAAAVTRAAVDAEMVRCPDSAAAAAMTAAIDAARADGDSVGGVVRCVCRGLPAGWGEPVFDKLEALLAHAMMSLPATKGFTIGSGFAGAAQRGSEHNDAFVAAADGLATATNRSGGVQGGISNGSQVDFRVAFKPPATIASAQSTVDFAGNDVTLAAPGRHDPCVVPRAVPIVEAMAALVLADAALRQRAREGRTG